jgi:hypothetical protein
VIRTRSEHDVHYSLELKVKYANFALSGMLLLSLVAVPLAARANQFKLPEELSRVESPRDMNLFAVEPTVINERYFTSGRCERQQYVGNVLPVGAPIPDSYPESAKVNIQHAPTPAGSSSSSSMQQQTPASATIAAPKAAPGKK